MLSKIKTIFRSKSTGSTVEQSINEAVSEQLPIVLAEEVQNAARLARIREVIATRNLNVDYPFSIRNIELTNKCPLKCVMCPRTYAMDRPQGLMEFDVFKRVIDEYVAVNFAVASSFDLDMHHFGDSLMHPEYAKFLKYATSRGVQTSDNVNPILLKDSLIDQILDGDVLKQLWISIDGHDNESFKNIRGLPNAYERSVQNLEKFLDRKVKTGSKMKVFVTVVDFDINSESIEKIKNHWTNYPGVDGFGAKGFVTFDGSVEQVNKFSKKYNTQEQSGTIWCNDPWTYMTVTWNGDVVPCCNDYNAKVVLGNVKNQSLGEIWQSEGIRQLRAEFMSGKASNPLCNKCEKTKFPRLYDPAFARRHKIVETA